MATLDVWLHDRRAGRLSQDRGRLSFAYGDDYLSRGGPALSQSLPLREEPFDDVETESWFANLLPEGRVRRAAARDADVSEGNDFGLLAQLGGECAGAVSLVRAGERPGGPDHPGRVRWLDRAAIGMAIESLPRRPLMADPDGDVRISLAGAQDKLVVVAEGERIGLPVGSTPSSHIVKPPIEGFDDTVANEAFCLQLADRLGLGVAGAAVREVAGHELLFVERYDRVQARGSLVRVHQEDFCQALGKPPELKYQSEGGPGLAECFDLVRATAAIPALDALRMVDAVTLNFLIGNHDAHGKNFSLLYADDGTRVAPFYDLLSTTVYELGDKMAMKLGGEYRAGYVRRRHVERFATETGLGRGAVLRRVRALAGRASTAAAALAGELRDSGGHRPVIDRIVETIASRAALLDSELD